ncbi:MAG TPA: hypothetical protein VFT22_24250 [Kofleriaceae bacterium]|nr:hypothetical protein [Kofleriaceae bacterium]
MVLHAIAAAIGWASLSPATATDTDVVDIEVAPAPPAPEALPAEVARPPAPDLAPAEPPEAEPASAAPAPPGEAPIDAGVDARIDAAIDARPDAAVKRDAGVDARVDAGPDAGPDAGSDAGPVAPDDAGADAGRPADDAGAPDDAVFTASGGPEPSDAPPADAGEASAVASADRADAAAGSSGAAPAGDAAPRIALVDAGGDAAQVARGAGSAAAAGAGSAAAPGAVAGTDADTRGPALDTAALAAALSEASGSGSGVPGQTTEPAVEGAPTTAGTAANLLSYFPDGHIVTALVRFDRLRGTEWAAQAERLLRPMPDYQLLFGRRDAAITDKLETLVISTPRPRDAAATTLVARTSLGRGALRSFLGAAAPVTWSASRGGLLGKRTATRFPDDHRVFLSPFQGWFLLAQPDDLAGLTAPTRGALDAAVATGKLPPWLAGIRKIESETGDPRGPALVVTLGLRGKRLKLGGNDFGLGIPSVPTPERVSLAMELVKQGWLVRGNMRFASEADAAELVASVQRFQQRVADSHAIQLVIGKPIVHVIANLAFARAGPRVSYATSISIADARAILAAAALQLDQYFGRAP